jgi:outer membrane protein/protease secretion system outer membrane protein
LLAVQAAQAQQAQQAAQPSPNPPSAQATEQRPAAQPAAAGNKAKAASAQKPTAAAKAGGAAKPANAAQAKKAQDVQPAPRWWLVPLGDRLNRGLDGMADWVNRKAQWDVPLGDRLNSTLDNVFAGMNLLVKPPADGSQAWWERPLADRLNARLDNLGRIIGNIEREDVVKLARDLGMDGPTIRPRRVLPAPDADVDPNADLGILQAWQAARVNDPTVRASRAGLAAAQERVPQARSQMLPLVQLGASRINNDLTRQGQNTASQSLQIFDRYPSSNDTLTLRQPVLRLQQVIGIRQAEASQREAEAIFSRDEQEYSARVVLTYLEVLLAQDTQRLVASQREFLQSALAAAKRSFEAGAGTRTDVDAAQAKVDLNRAQSLEVAQQVDLARRQLQSFINRPFGALLPIDGAKLASLALQDRTLEDWVRQTELSSPEVKRLIAQREGFRQEFNKARAAHLPTVDVIAQIQRSRSENTLAPQSQYQNRSVGLQINVPLYNGGYVNSATRQASAEVERLEETISAVKLELGVRVHREYRGVTEGVARVRALEVAVRSAEVALDSARKSMTAGVRTAVDVLNAEQQTSEARRNLNEARYGLVAAFVRLHTLAGLNGQELVEQIDQVLRR